MRNIVLIGFMGSGKSSVGRKLAKSLNFTFVDTDLVVEKNAGKKISEIFREQGEEIFRLLERVAVKEVSEKKNQVIACGGGVVLNPENIKNLKKHGVIVYLEAELPVIFERVKSSMERPLLDVADPEKQIKNLLEMREEKYKSAADLVINTSNLSVEEVVEEIQRQIEGIDNETR